MRSAEILEINEQASRIPNCIRFDKGSANFPFPEEFLPLIDDVKKSITGNYFAYPSIGGEQELKKQIVSFERENGRDVSSDDIVITHGGMSGIFTFLGVVTERGDEIITNEYFFEGFSLVIDYFKLQHRCINLADSNALQTAISERTRIIIINSPENPTGRVYTREETDAITRIAKERSILVLSDEVTNKIVYGDTRWAGPALEGGYVVAVNSFSKNWFIPGIRTGWTTSKNPDLNRRMAHFLSTQSVGVSVFAQLIMTHILHDIDDRIFRESCMRILSDRRNLMKRMLDTEKIPYLYEPKGGTNFYIDVKKDSRKVTSSLLTGSGIAVIPGDLFENKPSHYVRIGFGAVDGDAIKRGIEAISRVF